MRFTDFLDLTISNIHLVLAILCMLFSFVLFIYSNKDDDINDESGGTVLGIFLFVVSTVIISIYLFSDLISKDPIKGTFSPFPYVYVFIILVLICSIVWLFDWYNRDVGGHIGSYFSKWVLRSALLIFIVLYWGDRIYQIQISLVALLIFLLTFIKPLIFPLKNKIKKENGKKILFAGFQGTGKTTLEMALYGLANKRDFINNPSYFNSKKKGILKYFKRRIIRNSEIKQGDDGTISDNDKIDYKLDIFTEKTLFRKFPVKTAKMGEEREYSLSYYFLGLKWLKKHEIKLEVKDFPGENYKILIKDKLNEEEEDIRKTIIEDIKDAKHVFFCVPSNIIKDKKQRQNITKFIKEKCEETQFSIVVTKNDKRNTRYVKRKNIKTGMSPPKNVNGYYLASVCIEGRIRILDLRIKKEMEDQEDCLILVAKNNNGFDAILSKFISNEETNKYQAYTSKNEKKFKIESILKKDDHFQFNERKYYALRLDDDEKNGEENGTKESYTLVNIKNGNAIKKNEGDFEKISHENLKSKLKDNFGFKNEDLSFIDRYVPAHGNNYHGEGIEMILEKILRVSGLL